VPTDVRNGVGSHIVDYDLGRSCLRQLLTARGTRRAKARLADQHVTEWSEKDGVLTETQRIAITWGPPQW
jgi:hypothetical protein